MKPVIRLTDFEQESAHFDLLMPFKVKNLLIVSSLYDMYNLREDGQLVDMVMSEYADLRLSSAPAIKRVDSGVSAIEALKKGNYDLVIVFRSLSDIDAVDFSREARKLCAGLPVVLLAFHHHELELARDKGDNPYDNIFFWSGESKILLTIIKFIEDKLNVEADTKLAGVRVIILVENSVRVYSSFLPLIYTEIMQQTSALMSESINAANRLLRMRARPKILLAENFEDALELFKKYKKYLLGVISDIQFPKAGKINEKAGIQLARRIKRPLRKSNRDAVGNWDLVQGAYWMTCNETVQIPAAAALILQPHQELMENGLWHPTLVVRDWAEFAGVLLVVSAKGVRIMEGAPISTGFIVK